MADVLYGVSDEQILDLPHPASPAMRDVPHRR
jgi:hypothetical protein